MDFGDELGCPKRQIAGSRKQIGDGMWLRLTEKIGDDLVQMGIALSRRLCEVADAPPVMDIGMRWYRNGIANHCVTGDVFVAEPDAFE